MCCTLEDETLYGLWIRILSHLVANDVPIQTYSCRCSYETDKIDEIDEIDEIIKSSIDASNERGFFHS